MKVLVLALALLAANLVGSDGELGIGCTPAANGAIPNCVTVEGQAG